MKRSVRAKVQRIERQWQLDADSKRISQQAVVDDVRSL